MRYVGLAALAATFWLLVATVRLVVERPREAEASARALVSPPPAPTEAPPARHDFRCGLPHAHRAPPPPPEPPRGANPISKAAVVAGLNAVRPEVARCYEQFRVPGLALVNVVIAKNGGVSRAQVTGRFAGTPTVDCVEQAVKAARFPPSDGLTTPYPFQLR